MTTTTFDSNDLILNEPQQQQQQQCELPHFTVDEYESELNYFYEYDQDMAQVVNEAEYQDYCYQQEEQQQEEEADIMDDSLLKLIVDVQSYLAEAPTDSPLFALQYKMYTYLKQRAFEMGMEIPPSF
ncbi:hypothetical protein FB192DRAFT_1357534 [Mucor lusitanicus]|uniref:Uncharacterized protein n=2 Tax=Mucor circinelloides f. lusitanicus TaxID=29924 RepID=A0A168N186_MUCCL|nr:hypothetical protein FB192DRAFT_1357534 [Mucor lusitanicus]OAD05647.1 hypothetical protein MUCCIDRAFT_155953 [Mucor lusitanicus CBS 277.49]